MKPRGEIALMFLAASLGCRAIAGLTRDRDLWRDADAAAERAAKEYPGHPVTLALAEFRDQVAFFDGRTRAHAGRELRDVALAAAKPAPVGLQRADIHG